MKKKKEKSKKKKKNNNKNKQQPSLAQTRQCRRWPRDALMSCACLLPGCHLCFRSPLVFSGEQQASCACRLPGCPICKPARPDLHEHAILAHTHVNGGSGKPFSQDANELMCVLEFELDRMLEGAGPQYLVRGPDWENLVMSHKCARRHMLVAHLCHCGIWSIQKSTMIAAKAESHGEKTLWGLSPRFRIRHKWQHGWRLGHIIATRPQPHSTHFWRATHVIGGPGKQLSRDAYGIICVLEFELDRMLEGAGPQYLVKGPDWENLGGKCQPSFARWFTKGSRVGMLVAHLCHCDPWEVQKSTMLATGAEREGEKVF